MEIRRSDLDAQHQLEEMIRLEPDARTRAQLLILHQLSASQTDNTAAMRTFMEEVKALRADHDRHVKEETILIQQGRGAVKVIIWVLITAQAVLGFLYTEHIAALRALQESVFIAQKEIEAIQERHRVEERTGRIP